MVSVTLFNKPEFAQFENLLLENPVSASGRRLVPSPKFKISGLDPAEHYQLFMSFAHLTDYKIKYNGKQWQTTDVLGNKVKNQNVEHELKTALGETVMKNDYIEFPHLKITDNSNPENSSMIYLPQSQAFIPLVKVFKVKKNDNGEWEKVDKRSLKFLFPEIAFVTVRIYSDSKMRELKKISNDLARVGRTFTKTAKPSKRSSEDSDKSGIPTKRQSTGQQTSSSSNAAPPSNIQVNNSVSTNSTGQNMQMSTGINIPVQNQLPMTNPFFANPPYCSNYNLGPQPSNALLIPRPAYPVPPFNPAPVVYSQNNFPLAVPPSVTHPVLRPFYPSYPSYPFPTSPLQTGITYNIGAVVIPVRTPYCYPPFVPSTFPYSPYGINMNR